MSSSADNSALLNSFQAMDEEAQSVPGADRTVSDTAVTCPLKQRKRVRIIVRDQYFQLWKNKKYKLAIGGAEFEGNTGEAALVDQLVPPGVTDGELTVWWNDSDPKAKPLTWKLKIDDIDPLALDSGAETRLQNLGLAWKEANSKEPGTKAELGEFQGAFKVTGAEDGSIDTETRAKLDEAYSAKPIDSVSKLVYFLKDTPNQ